MSLGDLLATIGEALLMAFVADGLDGAVLGVGRRCGQPDVVVYSRDRCVEIMMGQGMSRPEAVECLEFNTFGAWVGY